MADDERLIEGVREWLERGGYVLEMRVARVLRELGASVDQGYPYTDPATQKTREGDISAMLDSDSTDDDHWHMLDLIVECKSTTAPWVGFQGERSGNGPWQPGSYMDPHCVLCMAMLINYGKLRRRAYNVYALTEKGSERGKDHAYEAVQQATNAALGKYPEDKWNGHPDAAIISMLAVPIVVTTSPLIVCELDAASGDMTLASVECMNVAVPRLGLPDRDAEGMDVLLVREPDLPALLAEFSELTVGWGNDREARLAAGMFRPGTDTTGP